MIRLRALLIAHVVMLVLTGGAGAATPDAVTVAPVTRLPFPERGFVIGVPEAAALDVSSVVVRENGVRVKGLQVDPLDSSGLRFGVVLALDASESMAGAPAAAALQSARGFVSRRTERQEVGIVTFNGDVSVLRGLTQNEVALRSTLATQPRLAYGTRIYDALTRSLALLRQARLSSGSIVLLSDGADIGSVDSLEKAVAVATRQRVRIFTVGLRSSTFEAGPLRLIAARTGGTFAEARSAAELELIYDNLGKQLAGEYLVRYRSAARPMSQVDVRIEVADVSRAATTTYVAPTPSLLAPYHRSEFSRFLLSSSSPVVISLLFAVLVGSLLLLLARGPKSTVVDRVQRFSSGTAQQRSDVSAVEALRTATRNRYASGWWAQLERDLELARMTITPRQIVAATLAAASLIVFLGLLLSAPVLGLSALGAPFVARGIVRRRLKSVRDDFAAQFPANLQVLASALRAGHSFNGALGVVVENAHEPARSEMARVVRDDQLGVLPEDAIRRLARRMANRDVEQVALLAELQRTSGGNSAEVLDTVVATIRERAEIRGLIRTLTAQGRMARWILTCLPIFLALFLWVTHPDVMNKFVTSVAGQVMLAIAAGMVFAGSVVIQRIIDIDV